MAIVAFDTLRLARKLEAAGFSTKQAGDTAEALADTLLGVVATKDDVVDVATKSFVASEIAATKSFVASEIAVTKSFVASEIAATKSFVASEIAATKSFVTAEIAQAKTEIIKWLVGLVGFQTLVILGGLATLLHAGSR
jgi:Asp-tRNA(Asn)/Glu-tRNA(Gln) amidotransferase B subunit